MSLHADVPAHDRRRLERLFSATPKFGVVGSDRRAFDSWLESNPDRNRKP
jgi:hypothetical protein